MSVVWSLVRLSGVYQDRSGGQRRVRAGRHRIRQAVLVLAAGSMLTLVGVDPYAAADQAMSFDPHNCHLFQPVPPLAQAWQVDRLAMDKVHQLATGKGKTIAVIDTGVDPLDTRYFKPNQVTTTNFAPNPVATPDKPVACEHGTGVVSLIAAQPASNAATDFQGIAPDVTILAIRALEDEPTDNKIEPLQPTIEAINYAADQHVDIISISQSGTSNPSYQQAIERALSRGIVVVTATGNGGGSAGPTKYPAAYPGVIAVGSSTPADIASLTSQYGPGLTVSVGAPGEDVLMLQPSGNRGQAFRTSSGTSFAAPLVAGTVALMLQLNPDLTPGQVKDRLEATADIPPAAVPDPQLGWGIVDPYRAVTDPTLPRPSAAAASSGPTASIEKQNPFDRPKPDHTKRNIAIAVAGGSLFAIGVAAVIAASLPAGRRRSWHPADRDTDQDTDA